MEFTINIKAANAEELSGTTSTDIGMAWVDQIRMETECPDLRLDLMYGYVHQIMTRDARCGVTEATARASGQFWEQNELQITVPARGLKRFYRLGTRITRQSETGAVTRVQVEWTLDKEALLAAWQEAGYPVIWDTENY